MDIMDINGHILSFSYSYTLLNKSKNNILWVFTLCLVQAITEGFYQVVVEL